MNSVTRTPGNQATGTHPQASLLHAVANLATSHREHEKYYAAAPLEEAVAHGHHLDLVVGDVERGGQWALLQPQDLAAHVRPKLASRLQSGSSSRNTLGSRTIARPIAPLTLPTGQHLRFAPCHTRTVRRGP